jgi:hypothetical protein
LSVAEEFVVLVVAAVAAADLGVVGDEFDSFDPLDLFEPELDLVAQPQRRAPAADPLRRRDRELGRKTASG